MTNRLVSNLYIIDSASTTVPLAYGNTVQSGSWQLATTANVGKMRVMSVIIMAQNTASRCVIALMSTENVILDYALNVGSTGGLYDQRTIVDSFGYGVPWRGVFIPVLTACTACLVLE